jgi:lysyl-tRNA synthetase class 2
VTSPNPDHPRADLPAQRRLKLERLRSKGINPFFNTHAVDFDCGEIGAKVENGSLELGTAISVAGRVAAIRNMGKNSFLDLRDATGRIQIFLSVRELGGADEEICALLDLGDILGVRGELFRTKTGELSVRASSIVLLAKALRPLPAKFHGLQDIETRHRRRYLDLAANPESCEIFRKRSFIVQAIREFLHERGFIEVETPMMQSLPGGAAAEPFKTHHNALNILLYLRIAPELYLKRLLVGGMTKIFEIGRNFRNEGISRRHNPEFTMLEAYLAYSDCAGMMELVETLVTHVARRVLGGTTIELRDEEGQVSRVIELGAPWRRVRYRDLLSGIVGVDWHSLSPAAMLERAQEHGILTDPSAAQLSSVEIGQAVFEKLIESKLISPTFVTHLPRELVPLAKIARDDVQSVEVFECCIGGQEIAPSYSEQNDPDEQRRQLEHQAGEEIQRIDEEFLAALEYGMPPAGGIGIGIDRLCMLLLGQENIRDVILWVFRELRGKIY